jgi:hypothetical protein
MPFCRVPFGLRFSSSQKQNLEDTFKGKFYRKKSLKLDKAQSYFRYISNIKFELLSDEKNVFESRDFFGVHKLFT